MSNNVAIPKNAIPAGGDIIVERKFENLDTPTANSSLKPLSEYYAHKTIIVLGDPGAGKTTTFKSEAGIEGGEYVEIRKFLRQPVQNYKDKILYLDALDEQRSSKVDGNNVLDQVISKLIELGNPSFRLSCREADWYGEIDKNQLAEVSGDKSVIVLKLALLNEENILHIAQNKVGTPHQFIAEAHKRGVFSLLQNPQTLKMVLSVVGATGKWPESKTELYETATKLLLKETNDAHARDVAGRFSESQLAEAAGMLCAYCLLADIKGFSINAADANFDYPFVGDVHENTDIGLLISTSERRLFNMDGKSHVVPVHRSIAEYLAAKYLVAQINAGKSIGRIFSIMTGEDGGTLSELRGLYAWVACLCTAQKEYLFKHDPLGITLYGDVSVLNTTDRCLLLKNLSDLASDNPWFRSENWSSHPFGAFCSPDMEKEFRKNLKDSSLSYAYVDCVLDAIRHGTPLPGLKSELIEIIYDTSREYVVRKQALPALINACDTPIAELRKLLDDINADKISDEDQELRGRILEILVPVHLSPAECLNYLCKTRRNFVGCYRMFYSDGLLKKVTDDHLPVFVDTLVESFSNAEEVDDHDYERYRFCGNILSRAIELYGEKIALDRLYKWLRLGVDRYDHSRVEPEIAKKISGWFSMRPDLYFSLYKYVISNTDESDLFRAQYALGNRACSPKLSSEQCVEFLFAEAATEEKPTKAEYFFLQAYKALLYKEPFTSTDNKFFFDYLERYPRFQKYYDNSLSQSKLSDEMRKMAGLEKQRKKAEAERIASFVKVKKSIAAGKHLQALDQIAHCFFGFGVNNDKKSSPLQQVENEFGIEVMQAAHQGFLALLQRNDIYSPTDIFLNNCKSSRFFFAFPALAGMELYYQQNNGDLSGLTENTLSSLIAFKLVTPTDRETAWFSDILVQYTDLAVSIYEMYFDISLGEKQENIGELYDLADKEHVAVVRDRLALRLLTKYPGCSSTSLSLLIRAVFGAGKRKEIAALAEKQVIKNADLSDEQKAIWLVTAFLLNPKRWEKEFIHYFGRSHGWAYLLTYDSGHYWKSLCANALSILEKANDKLISNLPSHFIESIISTLGRNSYPADPYSGGGRILSVIGDDQQITEMVRKLTAILTTYTDTVATLALSRLKEDAELIHWRNYLRLAYYQHTRKKREANFTVPKFAEVKSILSDSAPARVSDLFALISDHLHDIAKIIRTESPPKYHLFWNMDKYRRLVNPVVEEVARDRLLGILKERLKPLGIVPEKEGHYANDTRADIKIPYSLWNLPVEVKRHNHADLWTALEDQLIEKYTIDPGAEGYGIYIVFWFGQKWNKLPKPPIGIAVPNTADELEKALTCLIPASKKNHIKVICLDCSNTI